MGRAAALDSDPDGADTGFLRRMPFHPDQLAVSLRVIDIADRIGAAFDHKLHGDRVVRVRLTAGHLHGGDHICVHPVFVVKLVDLRRLQLVVEPDNANAQRGDDLVVAHLAGGAARPGGIPQVCFLQKDGQRQVLMGQRAHPVSKITVNCLIIKGSFGCGHSVVGAAVNQVCNRLNDDFIITANQGVKIHPNIPGNGPNDLFIRKITADGINAGRIAAGGDNAGKALGWTYASISAYNWP